jgi:hypothetical protein
MLVHAEQPYKHLPLEASGTPPLEECTEAHGTGLGVVAMIQALVICPD